MLGGAPPLLAIDETAPILDYNLHELLLEACSSSENDKEKWQPLKACLEQLRAEKDPRVILNTLCERSDDNGRTPVHQVIAMAPVNLCNLIMSIVPIDELQSLLESQDNDGNTPLHLACHNIPLAERPKIPGKDEGGGASADSSVIEMLTVGCPTAHAIVNKPGEIPLALLLTAPNLQIQNNNITQKHSNVAAFVKMIVSTNSSLVSIADETTGMTLLHKAAAASQVIDESVLLAMLESAESQTSVQTPDKAGRLPLHYVAAGAGATFPKQSAEIQNKADEENHLGIMRDVSINIPITFANWLIQIFPNAVVHPCKSGDTPLHLLIHGLCSGSSKKKSKKDNDNDVEEEEEEDEVMTSKPSMSLPESMQRLIRFLMGPDVEPLCPLLVKNRDELTPLHSCALFHAPTNVAKILMSSPFAKKAVTISDLNQATPLHLICGSANIAEMVDLLTVMGTAEAAILLDRKDRTPLHVAAENKKSTKLVVKALIDINPQAAQMESAKNHRRMPFHLALKKKADESIIKALLRAYPDAVKAVFDGSNTLFHEMCQQKTPYSTVQGLLPIYPEGVKIANEHGNLPLHLATAHKCSLEVVRAFVEAYPEACMTKNKHKDLPLHYAVVYPESAEIVRLLVENNPAAISEPNENGESAIDMAIASDMDDEIVQLMKKLAPSPPAVVNKAKTASTDKKKPDETKSKTSERPAAAMSAGQKSPPKKQSTTSGDNKDGQSHKKESIGNKEEDDNRSKRSERRTSRLVKAAPQVDSTATAKNGETANKKKPVAAGKDERQSTNDPKESGDTKSKRRDTNKSTSSRQTKPPTNPSSPRKKEGSSLFSSAKDTSDTKEKKQERRSSKVTAKLPPQKGANMEESLASLQPADLAQNKKSKGNSKKDGSSGDLENSGSKNSSSKGDSKNDSKDDLKKKARSRSKTRNDDASTGNNTSGERRRERRAVKKEETDEKPRRRRSKDAESMSASVSAFSKASGATSPDRKNRSLSKTRSSSRDLGASRRALSKDRSRSKDAERTRSRSKTRMRSKSKDRARSKSAGRRQRRRERLTAPGTTPKRRAASSGSLFEGLEGSMPLMDDSARYSAKSSNRVQDKGGIPTTPTSSSRRRRVATGIPTSPGTLVVPGRIRRGSGLVQETLGEPRSPGSLTPGRSKSSSIQDTVGAPRTPTGMSMATPGRSKSSSMVEELVAADLHMSSRLFLPPADDR